MKLFSGKAHDLLATLGTSGIADLKTAIAINSILAGLPVTIKDVDLVEKIFGPDLGTLKEKTTRRKPLPLVRNQIPILPELYEKRQ